MQPAVSSRVLRLPEGKPRSSEIFRGFAVGAAPALRNEGISSTFGGFRKLPKIRVFPTIIGLALTLTVSVATAQEQRINLDPGRWQYATTLSVDGRDVVLQNTERFCIDAATANMSATDVVGLLTDGQCRASNTILTAGSGSAQMSCEYPEDNARGEGEIRATYTATTYDVRAELMITGPGGSTTAHSAGNARGVSDCN
ncbi:DUF3617 domain-containing protein [Rhodobacteraceae bacterium]|nr:DUF3617 domain-containing protein [Paracoccaceae bacterium]